MVYHALNLDEKQLNFSYRIQKEGGEQDDDAPMSKEDEEKVNQAEQLIESLYPKADKRNKNARTIDALNMLRANISYEQVKKDMEARVYEELQEAKVEERKDNAVTPDVVALRVAHRV